MILKSMNDKYYEYCRKNKLIPTEEGYKIWFEELDILNHKKQVVDNDIFKKENKIQKYYYHATKEKNLGSILSQGLKPGFDGLVYMADTEQNAVQFISLRVYGTDENIIVIQINTEELDKSLFDEGYDHSPEFFKGDVKTYAGIIPSESFEGITTYTKNVKK